MSCHTSTYNTWCLLKSRCTNPNNKAWKNYGGRGITVCERWVNSFENFLDDMGEKPGKEYSIDRINNNKGYSPENCRWATRMEQQNNTTANHLLTYNGKTQTMAQWAKEINISYQALKCRINKHKWTIERALTKPVRLCGPCKDYYITYNGKTQTIEQWSKECNLLYGTLCARIIRYKWPIEKALNEPLHPGSHQKV